MKLSTLGAVSAALAVCATASAQTPPYQPLGASIRVGGLLFTSRSDGDNSGSGAFAFGADYLLGARVPQFLGRNGHLSLSVDYYRHGDKGDIPILLNYVVTANRFYAEIGAGVGFENDGNNDDTGFAYEGGIGYNLPTTSSLPVFVQVNYMGADRSKVNGFGFYIGVRF